jgi:hypothetical protein
LLIFLSFFCAEKTISQTVIQWKRHADLSFKERDYYGAAIYYRKAMLIDSSNLEIVHGYAESLRLYNDYILAEKYYKYVYTRDNKKVYPETLFWWASMQKYNAKYEEARKNFIRFSGFYKNKESFYYKKAIQESKSCEFAQFLMKDTLPVHVYNAGNKINTTNAEFAPIFITDTNILFSSPRTEKIVKYKPRKEPSYFIRVFKAAKKDTVWTFISPADTVLSVEEMHAANGTFSLDRKAFYFSVCDVDMICDIYSSTIDTTGWKPAVKLGPNINMHGYTTTQPQISKGPAGEEVLYFVSNKPGGFGGLDIWYANRTGNDFTTAVNIGPKVNTIDDEISPWYDTIQKAFYFSSGWHYGLGGYDIFKSEGAIGTFKEPENIGYPINSSVNDFYYTLSPGRKTALLSSNRKGSITAKSETCCNDLWYLNLPEQPKADTIVLTKLEDLNKYFPVTLYFNNDEPNPKSLDTTTTLDYLETFEGYTGFTQKYIDEYTQGLEGLAKDSATEIINDFFENKVDKGAEDLEIFASLLLQHLNRGQRVELTVKGYASPLAQSDYNVNLTQRRISSFINYFRRYKNGVYLPYLADSASNKGFLKINRVPFGEYKALQQVNDSYDEQKHSVYSIAAALERKIEIVKVTLAHKDSISAEIDFHKEVYNFGKVKKGEKLETSFYFRNTGNSPLMISAVRDSCHCLTYNWPSEIIQQKGKGKIDVIWDTKNLKGKQSITIYVGSNAAHAHKELTLTAELE